MLSDIIQIDLHIHSNISEYKEDNNILVNSDIKHIDVLLQKLKENNIGMFALTNHNRFDYDLYEAFVNKLESFKLDNSIPTKKILPGIEFDVTLEKGKDSCHIISIFNDKNVEKIRNISTAISKNRILGKNDSYTKEEFEKILKDIGVDVILIVHQKQSFDNDKMHTHSLSNSCDKPDYFLQVGYINSLEFSKPKVEGIVKNCLRDLNLDFPLITGSDCHTWENYPYHSKSGTEKKTFTKFKCLPTFKGLLLSITSFNTRANRRVNQNNKACSKIVLNNQVINLSNGINAIIGDNGSGKSLLLNYLANKGNVKSFYKTLVKDNGLSVQYLSEEIALSELKYIQQDEINNRVVNATLFKSDDKIYYKDISNNTIFSSSILTYFNCLISYVENQIKTEENNNKIANSNYKIVAIDNRHHLPVINKTVDSIKNPHSKRLDELSKIYDSMNTEILRNEEYYKSNNLYDEFINIFSELNRIIHRVRYSNNQICNKNISNGIIVKHLNNYDSILSSRRATEESDQVDLKNTRDNFVNTVLSYIKSNQIKIEKPRFPDKISGFSENEYKTYKFTKIAKYHQQDVRKEFFDILFKSPYNNENEFLNIKSKVELDSAFKYGCYTDLNIFIEKRVKEVFIKDYLSEETSIKEIDSNSAIGNTPGQIALVFYKFTFQEFNDELSVILIDQPEDDINPKRIEKYLLQYLGGVRDKKQVFLVTHNPLLVINLDVDNVIYLEKINNKINAKYGAIEYDDKYSILDLIRDNLEGGYDAIERRLKIYGK